MLLYQGYIEAINGPSWGFCEPSLAEAMAKVFALGTFVLVSTGRHAQDLRAVIAPVCSTCRGEGKIRIPRPRSVQIKRCPECKGKAAPDPIVFPVALHVNALQDLQALGGPYGSTAQKD
jgi:hypothetical protein